MLAKQDLALHIADSTQMRLDPKTPIFHALPHFTAEMKALRAPLEIV
ncbi:MAG: hypothetical protein ACK4VW_01170 [Anaerolineales bacterium]